MVVRTKKYVLVRVTARGGSERFERTMLYVHTLYAVRETHRVARGQCQGKLNIPFYRVRDLDLS